MNIYEERIFIAVEKGPDLFKYPRRFENLFFDPEFKSIRFYKRVWRTDRKDFEINTRLNSIYVLL